MSVTNYNKTVVYDRTPVMDSTPFHIPYVRDTDSLALDAQHDVAAAQDRARAQELSRFDALTSNRQIGLCFQNAVNRQLDNELEVQRARVVEAATDAYAPKGPHLNGPVSATTRGITYAPQPGL
eukprot:TRINITY_DN26036_c0_g1_i1.p2 TRINITY_DN26036_c0_g1~~TRINITY_DN26036_c0_g1_i1.p2  ORF type:complete len:124 (+),score=42.16 TRINITY_DN26036_c0_g1_i1:51-422(+)